MNKIFLWASIVFLAFCVFRFALEGQPIYGRKTTYVCHFYKVTGSDPAGNAQASGLTSIFDTLSILPLIACVLIFFLNRNAKFVGLSRQAALVIGYALLLPIVINGILMLPSTAREILAVIKTKIDH